MITRTIKWISRQPYNLKKLYVQYISVLKLRNSIKKNKIRIVVGAGLNFEKDWIPLEITKLNIVEKNDWINLFNEESIDAILAEHVWEHLTKDEASLAVCNCYDFLKRGGYIRIAVPDGYHPDKDYIEHVKPGGTGEGSHDHKILYNYQTLTDLLIKAGFKVQLLEYFDEKGEFHATDWSPEKGKVNRSARYDHRNMDGQLNYTSLILDAFKI